eukprot:COSAG01_NODE_2917_length_6859_cov_3.995414_8_plen_49_part_00
MRFRPTSVDRSTAIYIKTPESCFPAFRQSAQDNLRLVEPSAAPLLEAG